MKSRIITLFLLVSSLSMSLWAEIINRNANNCEFYVDHFRVDYTSHYGFDEEAMVSKIVLKGFQGELLRLGQWILFDEKRDGQWLRYRHQTINASPYYLQLMANHLWEVRFPIKQLFNRPENNFQRTIHEFAYFIDVVRNDGNVYRLWMSNNGKNFSFYETMNGPVSSYPIPYGRAKAPNDGVKLYYQKWTCR
jgi:hypothetical protein